MPEALRLQIPKPTLLCNTNFAGLIGDFANARDRYTVDSFWQPAHVIGPNREQQLEVFAAMQGQHQRIKRASAAQFPYVLIDWER